MLLRITLKLIRKPSNTYFWVYLEQVILKVCSCVQSNQWLFIRSQCPAYLTMYKMFLLMSDNDSSSCAGYVAYFIAACVLDFQRATALVVLTVLAVVIISYELLKKYKGKSISRCFQPAVKCLKSNMKWIKW